MVTVALANLPAPAIFLGASERTFGSLLLAGFWDNRLGAFPLDRHLHRDA
ncbi:hypothetical protein [Bradyrhizobium genosp. P]